MATYYSDTSYSDTQAIHEKERLYNFLKKYDLHKYYQKFLLKGVHRLSHLKDVSVDETSLDEIGLSRIERQRLRKKVRENVAWRGRFVKKLTGREREFNAPIPNIPTNQEPESRRSAAIIPNDEVKLIRKIGEGAHGAVHEGTWADTHGAVAVAVKTLYGKQEDQNMFIKEANSMSILNHKHIIQLYGIVLSHPLKLIEELAQFGSLHKYIQKEGRYLSLQLFHTYACQIADAMSYLEKRRILHRDLAIRNVLLAHVDHVKLSDFGMARVLDENCDVYNLSNLASRIPVAWTALEALTMAKFSSASDVWSFGVSIWEIYSLGDIPWKGLDPMAIKDLLVEGERLGCPVRCPADIYELVQTCWRENPQVRPTFAEIHQKLQLLVPKQVRGLKNHNATDDPGSLSFKTGELLYIIDRPSMEWICGMKTDGTFGHFRSDCVTEILNPIEEIRAKLASGKTSISSISIGSPTGVNHMVHVNHDGTKIISENLDAVFDPTPPSTPDQSIRNNVFNPTSPPSPLPPFRVIDARSPSPKDSPLINAAASHDHRSSTKSPHNLIDITKIGNNIIERDIADNIGRDMTDQYVTMSQPAAFTSLNRDMPAQQMEGDEAPSDLSDKYVTMQSYSVKRAVDNNEEGRPQCPLPPREASSNKKRSATLLSSSTGISGDLNTLFSEVGDSHGQSPKKDIVNSEVTDNHSPPQYDKPRSFTMNPNVPFSSSLTMPLLDSSIGLGSLQQPLVPARSQRPQSESFASPSSSLHRKESSDRPSKCTDHVSLYIPENGMAGYVPQKENSPVVPKSTRFISSGLGVNHQSSMSVPIPKPRTRTREANGSSVSEEVETATRGNSEASQLSPFDCTTTNTPKRPAPYAPKASPKRPAPPVPKASPRRSVDPSKEEGDYQLINPKTRTKSEYMVLNPKTKSGSSQNDSDNKSSSDKLGNPKTKTGSSQNDSDNKASSDKLGDPRTEFAEGKLQLILSDDEFVGCEIEICKFALEQEDFNVEMAKEEIRVQILLGMLLPNIREEDCRRALVHCQHKTNRAAAWLLQLSTEIQDKIQ